MLGLSYFLGFALGCLFGTRLLERVGHIRSFAAMASAGPLIHGLIVIAPVWWLMRLVTGFCFAVLYVVIESWLNERATNETRGTILSLYLIINLTVITLGQLMLMLYDPGGLALFALAAVMVSIAAVPVALTASQQPAAVPHVRVRVGRLYRISPVGFMGCFFVGLPNGAFWAVGPVCASSAGLDVAGIAWFMSAIVIGGALGQWPFGRLSDRTDRRRVLVLGAAGAAAVWVAAAVMSAQVTGMFFCVIGLLWGMFAFPLVAIAMAHTNDSAEAGDFVEISSGLLLVAAAGSIAGPLLAGGLMAGIGSAGFFDTVN